jgi:Tol biopolymer transport system component
MEGESKLTRVRLALCALIATVTTALAAPAAQAAFPGGDGLIVFDRYPRTNLPFEEIYVVKPSGGGLTRLTDRAGAEASSVYPDWNASGTRIAFQRGTATTNRIVIIKPSGAVVATFGDAGCAGGVGMPSWSPNGTTIAYTCFESDDWLIKTFDLVSRDRDIIATDDINFQPEFSPSGDAIAYSAERENGARYEVIVAYLDVNGEVTSDEVMAGDAAESAISPDWSPDGSQIAYACASIVPVFTDQDICTVDTSAPGTGSPLITSGNQEQFPAFSPSGSQIVWAVGPEEGDTELKRRAISGGPATTVTSNRVVDQQADWGPR